MMYGYTVEMAPDGSAHTYQVSWWLNSEIQLRGLSQVSESVLLVPLGTRSSGSGIWVILRVEGTSHMSDNRQISIAMQRLVDFISLVTHKHNNTGVVTITTSPQGIISTVWEAVVLVWLMRVIYDLCHWNGLKFQAFKYHYSNYSNDLRGRIVGTADIRNLSERRTS
jgi:hypothetical protein